MKKYSIIFLLSLFGFSLHVKGATMEQNSTKVEIHIISDVVCPWCAIGYNRLNKAITELHVKEDLNIIWHPFELNPDMPEEGMDDSKYLMNKYSLSKEQLNQTREQVTKLGEEVDFTFDYFQDMKKVKTLNAHILLNYAKKFNKQTELKTYLQKAYFSDRKDINDKNILFEALQNVGLDAKEAIKLLDKKEEIIRVRNEEEYWKKQGVFSIPTMIFDANIVEVGAQSVDRYKEILTTILEK